MTANLWPGAPGRPSRFKPRSGDDHFGQDDDGVVVQHVALEDHSLVKRQGVADDPGERGHDDRGEARVADCRIGVHLGLLGSVCLLVESGWLKSTLSAWCRLWALARPRTNAVSDARLRET